ncbi:PREDICTED: F-box only protein 4-like [Gekko japonicus]|uniref:F-box only protein 4-like n=1 Tax=Gekko japonicus TaxID=146911 RepID=A0ABM1L1X4_GEKJA|nr:PREDICTED: F-box only protein 4-like [Gekko japonicus]
MAAGNSGDWHRFESALRSSLRLLRDRLRRHGGLPGRDDRAEAEEPEQQPPPSALQALSIEVKLYILTFLTPKDLYRLGCTSRYWQLTVQDPLLWRYLIIRDHPSWRSIDWKSLPDADVFNRSVSALHEGTPADYMAIYKKCSSGSKRPLESGQSSYRAVTSPLHSLVTQEEPLFSMFGPGLEDLDESLVLKMMTSPEVLPLAGIPRRQIPGIGTGVKFHYKNHQRSNIFTLYSLMSKNRGTAREESANSVNKLFDKINSSDGTTQYNPNEQVKDLCHSVDGFIYVADAEAQKRHSRQTEVAQMAAMLNPALGPPGRPVLILTCIARAGIKRIPCIYMAHQLQLNALCQPWMVQDIEVATLDGLLDGIEWLLGETGYDNAQ